MSQSKYCSWRLRTRCNGWEFRVKSTVAFQTSRKLCIPVPACPGFPCRWLWHWFKKRARRVVLSVMNDVWQMFAKEMRKKAAGAGLGSSACNSCTKERDLEIMWLSGSAGRVESSMNQKSFLNNKVRCRNGFLFQTQCSSPSKWIFSRAVEPWMFHVQGLGSGGG